MTDYIERKAALKMLDFCGGILARYIGNVIKSIPAADVASVVHGRWFCGEYDTPRCSECLSGALLDGSEDYVKSKYCPNCGALMDGGEHD